MDDTYMRGFADRCRQESKPEAPDSSDDESVHVPPAPPSLGVPEARHGTLSAAYLGGRLPVAMRRAWLQHAAGEEACRPGAGDEVVILTAEQRRQLRARRSSSRGARRRNTRASSACSSRASASSESTASPQPARRSRR